ncbi:MAG: hypothetical protein KC519_22810, partial [Anaerolineae bacterium]|nr:hypothetical protein [Anaerolineae bacterium]
MKMDGNYHIVLKPGANEADFVGHVDKEFSTIGFATRITRAITNRLLKVTDKSFSPHYVLQVSVDLVTEVPYGFAEHVPHISGLVEPFGV